MTGAAVGVSLSDEKTVASSDQLEVKAAPLPASQMPAPPPVWWRAIVEFPERRTWKREHSNRNRWRPSPKEALEPSRRQWQPLQVPSSNDPTVFAEEYRVDVSWGVFIPWHKFKIVCAGNG